MITINLLPPELRPIKRTPIPYILSGAILGIAVVVVALLYVRNEGDIAEAAEAFREHKKQLEDLQPVIDEANELADKKKELSERVETISEITRDRTIWSKQIFHLTQLALENLWFNEISVEPRTETVEREVYDPQRKTTVKRRDRVTRQILSVNGYVVPGEGGQASVSPFTVIAETDPDFSETFSLDPQTEILDTEFEDISVREFTLEFRVDKKGSSDE